MFQLIKIEYGRDNVPEPILMPATAGVTYTMGTALYLDSSSHTLKIAAGDQTAAYVALENKAAAEGDRVLCYRISPQMLFEAPLTAYNASTVVPGGRLQFSADGNGLTATAASGVTVADNRITAALGAYVENTLSAKAEGDTLFVRLA